MYKQKGLKRTAHNNKMYVQDSSAAVTEVGVKERIGGKAKEITIRESKCWGENAERG